MNTIVVKHYFDAAHQLPDTEWLVTKACARLHGHTYAVEITAQTPELNGAGMVIDFKAIKEALEELIVNTPDESERPQDAEYATPFALLEAVQGTAK